MKVASATVKEYKKCLNLGVSMLLDHFLTMDVAFKVVGAGSGETMCGVITMPVC